MKKKIIVGVILIFLAVGGTLAMNVVGIFRGTPYTLTSGRGQYIFYGNTYEYSSIREDGTIYDVANGFYERNGKKIGYMKWGLSQKGEINTFVYVTGDNTYINKTAIAVQVSLVVMFAFGVIEILIACCSKRKISNQ